MERNMENRRRIRRIQRLSVIILIFMMLLAATIAGCFFVVWFVKHVAAGYFVLIGGCFAAAGCLFRGMCQKNYETITGCEREASDLRMAA